MKKKAFTLVETLLLVILLIGALVLFVGIINSNAIANNQKKAAEKAKVLENEVYSPEPPTDYNNNVYYFPQVGREYAKALSYFKDRHPNLEETSAVPDVVRMNGNTIVKPNGNFDGYRDYSAAVGVTVTFKEKDLKEVH